MSRKIVYVNGQNETITFEDSPYLITTIEGLGIPNIDRQEQKAPYQDGSTYIDALLQNRDIVVELAITKPNNFADIATYRRELSQRLCPKYGMGTLTYTDEDNNSYAIQAVVASMVFPNKDFREPFMRALVTFTANDPYWRATGSTAINLPTSVTSAPAIINSGNSQYSTLIQLADDSFLIAYVSAALPGVVVRRKTGATWGAEETVRVGASAYTSLIQLENGDLFIVYKRNSDNYLVSKTYTGGAWSASESIITTTLVSYPCVIQRADGSLFLVYKNAGTGYIQSQTYLSSWSSAVDCFTGSSPKVIEQTDGRLAAVYINLSSSFPSVRYYDGTWGAETITDSAVAVIPTLIQRKDGSLLALYTRASDSYIVSQVSSNNAWQSAMIVNAEASFYPTVVEYDSSDLAIAYSMDIASPTPFRLMEVFRSVNPVPAVITGDVPAPFVVTFNGPSVNPRIINQNTLEYIRLNTTLAAADTFDVDTSFGNKTVKLTQGGIVKNGIAFLDIGSTFFQLARPTLPSLPIGVNPYRGLKAYWNMDSVPEIPDDPAGVTTLSTNFTDAQGWAAINCTLSYSSGKMILTATAPFPGIYRTVTAEKTIRAKFKKLTGSATNSRFINTSGVIFTSTKTYDGSGIHDAYITAGATGNIQFYPGLTGSAIGDTFEIDFIYIGTGAYLPNSLIDNSGNGNHGTIYGATPVEGISGKALAFDGVNDYCVTTSVFPLQDIMHFHAVAKSTAQAVTAQVIFETGTIGTSGWLEIDRLQSSDSLRIIGNDGVNTAEFLCANYFTNGAFITVDVSLNFTAKTISVYKNGVLFSSGSFTAIKPPSGVLYIGIRTANTAIFYGTIDEPRIYNRALSAEEVQYLYDNPGVPIPTDATVVYYEDDAVLSAATATMEWTERYVGL